MPKQPTPSTSDPFADLDLGQLAEVTGGCGGHGKRHQQPPQDPGYPPSPWGNPYGGGNPYNNNGVDVQTNVDIGQQGQSIIRR
jgi:hypothetical protein